MKKRSFPSQKKSYKQKTMNWRKKHFEWAEEFIQHENSPIRSNLQTKYRAFRAYVGKLTRQDYSSILNPGNLKSIEMTLPDDIEHMPIAVSYLDVLLGEEFDRRFDFRALVSNPDSISRIENDKKRLLQEEVERLVKDTSLNEEDAVKQLEKYIKYLYTEYQDAREMRCNQLLRHFIKELDLKLKFNEGFKNVLLGSEEHYLGDIVNGNPVIECIDIKKIEILRSGNSNRTEDADVIILWDYWSPGQIIDRYYKFLSEDDIKKLDEEFTNRSVNYNGRTDAEFDEDYINATRTDFNNAMNAAGIDMPFVNERIAKLEQMDDYGNWRVIRLFWKSKKKIVRSKKYDVDGRVTYEYYSENYIPDTKMGEEVEEYWVSHWWEGVQVGADIYPYIRPRQLQFNKLNDPGYNHPGIVGQTYNVSGMRATSMMDRAIKYNLIYDVIFHNMKDAMSKYFGSLPVVDLAELPDGWDVKKWLFFARKAGIAVKDSFREGTKGRALGMLAGGLSGSQNMMNQQGLGEYINQMMNLLSFIEQQMGRVIGVPPQRLGDIQNRETVGGVERAVTQSSYITNERFKVHDNVKKRVLTMLLELCKTAYKSNPTKFQNISDTFLNETFSIDDEVLEEEYGVVVDNEVDIAKVEQKLEGLTQAAIQAQMLSFSDVMKFYVTSSLAEKQRIIEKSEQETKKRAEEAQAQEQQMQQQQMAQMQQQAEAQAQAEEQERLFKVKEHEDKIAMDKYKVDEQELTKRMELDLKDYDIEEARKMSLKELNDKLSMNDKEMELKLKEFNESIRATKAQEQIALKKIQADKAKAAQAKKNKASGK